MVNNPDHPHFLSSLEEVSLKASGYAFLLGDAALFAAGWKEGNFKAASAGLFWSFGGLAAAYGGNPSEEKQLALLSHRLGQHLREQRIAIPETPDNAQLLTNGGAAGVVQDFLLKHPADILNVFSVLGATQVLRSGLKHRFTPDIASGILAGAGGLAGLLIQERKADPDHPQQGILGAISDWVHERPLRITGGLQAANNIAMFWGSRAKQEREPQKGSYGLRYASAAAYLFANCMLFLSSKNNERITHPPVLQRLGTLSAGVIAAQPPEMQAALLQEVAGYLARQPGTPPEAELVALLQAKLAEQPQTPVTAPVEGWRQKVTKAETPQQRIPS